MVRTKDPLLEVFRRRDDAAFREEFMKSLETKQMGRKERQAANNPAPKGGRMQSAHRARHPESVSPGKGRRLKHHFPAESGRRQVTLKTARVTASNASN